MYRHERTTQVAVRSVQLVAVATFRKSSLLGNASDRLQNGLILGLKSDMPRLLTAVSGAARHRHYGRTCRTNHGTGAWAGGSYHGEARNALGPVPHLGSKWLASTPRRGVGEDTEVQS